MRHALIAAFLALLALAAPAAAEERVTLGVGRLFTNDALGDRQDRWQTGSYQVSWVRAAPGTVGLPEGFGALMEYRFASRIITPTDLSTPAAGDRPYAGIMSLGAYTHFARSGYEFAVGAELVGVGPATKLADFQLAAHDAFGLAAPSATVRAGQIGNAIYPTLSVEMARPLDLDFVGGSGLVLRPFVQARAGDETYLRAGADFLFGPEFTSGVLARDEVTGLPYQTAARATAPGLSFLVGADTAKVLRSAWLPASDGYTLSSLRNRVRAGVSWQGDYMGVFYGATWLGPEFSAQPEGQVVGSLQLSYQF